MLQPVIRAPRTAQDIAQGERLARMEKRDIGPTDVARVLNAAKLSYVLVGAHAANGYSGRPRSTVDVDVIVQFPAKAAKVIADAFRDLTMLDTAVVIRFKRAGGEEAIDLMKPTSSLLWKRLLQIAVEVDIDGTPVRIPPVEGVLAAKFSAMTSPLRQLLDRQQDGIDFARVVVVNDDLNMSLLRELGDLVFPDDGEFVCRLVVDARAGRKLEF